MLFSGKLKFSQQLFIGTFLLLAVCITACEEEDKFSGVPTIAPEYLNPTALPTFTRLPTLTPIPNATPTKELPLKTIVIFDDGFQNGWRLIGNDLVAEITKELLYDGSRSIKVIPRLPFAELFIVSGSENRRPIRREDIITVSFYLNGGPASISFDDLTITAQGSNANLFWVEDDRSAITTSDALFVDTQLAFLGIIEIPANRWGRVEFQPQEQQFDPVYDNFTGFYLSNADTLLTPYYIDRIEILMVDL